MAAFGQGGRKAGVPNKVGAKVKADILDVFLKVGGRGAMALWALENRTEFYKIYARLIPTEVHAEVDVRDATELTDAELVAIATASSIGTAGEASGEEILPPIH